MVDETKKLGAVNIDLGSERLQSGAALLALTDRVDFGAVGAAWMFAMEEQRWKFMLFTPMVDSRGPLWIYQRLLQVFSKLDLPEGITPLDIIVGSPREMFYRQFPYRSRLPKDGNSIINMTKALPASVIGGIIFGSIVMYRMEEWHEDVDVSEQFDSQVKALLAA
jgi:hypothetical protein